MTSITITWKAHMDDRTCPTCMELNGKTWTFTTPEPMPDFLTYNGKIVWNVAQGSQAHGHERFNCRCSITPEINVNNIKQKIEKMKTDLEANYPEQFR